MKILVIVKQVISDLSMLDVADNALDFSLATPQTSSLDLAAIEQAVLLKEQGLASHLTVCCVGDKTLDKSLRTALAMGIDEAVHILADHHQLDLLSYAKLLQNFIAAHDFSLVLTGREDFNGSAGQSGTMLAGLLGWAGADYVTSIEKIEEPHCDVGCDSDVGHRGLNLLLPAVLSVDSGLNAPRFVKFPELLKARKQAVQLIDADGLDLDLSADFETIEIRKVAQNRKQTRLKDTAALADILKQHRRG